MAGIGALMAAAVLGAASTPPILEQPGSQPREVALDPAENCDSCHSGYDRAVEPGTAWSGSMMAHAARDPLFWAALAVAEQDFVPNPTAWANLFPATTPDTGGAGELCLRCHAPSGWIEGRSLPSDGSGLAPQDRQGVGCDVCHRALDPVSAEGRSLVAPGREPWWTNPRTSAEEGYHGSAQLVFERRNDKRGPYDNAAASHGVEALAFQREGELCGTCHDVSNPVTGGLAPGSGRLDPVELGPRAAFDNPPYAYGVVERTFSEWRASRWPQALAGDLAALPVELRRLGGAPVEASLQAGYGSSADPAFNPPRRFTCQTCHLPAVTGRGCSEPVALRGDLPHHDLTGGNTWVPQAMIWLSGQGRLAGGPLRPEQAGALGAGVERARRTLRRAAALEPRTSPDGLSLVVRTINLTGHKLPSGYPEGRRMWLNVRFFDSASTLLREHGAYDPANAELARDTRIFEVRPAMTRAWAERLVGWGWDAGMPLTFLAGGTPEWTLGALAAGTAGPALETFHFVLNDHVAEDRRLPPFGLDPSLAAERQSSPVPAGAFPTLPDGTLAFWDESSFTLAPGAVRAEIVLYYQTASKEYVEFLLHANFTNGLGADLHDAWVATGKSPPEEVARAEWRLDLCTRPPDPALLLAVRRDGEVELSAAADPAAAWWRLERHATPDRSDAAAWAEEASPLLRDPVMGDGRSWYYDLRPANRCGQAPR